MTVARSVAVADLARRLGVCRAYWDGCLKVTTLEERRQISIDFGDKWTEQAFSIPLVWVFAEVPVNPAIVAEYRVNMLHIGPTRYHEHTRAVFQ